MKAVHHQFNRDLHVRSPLIVLVWQIPCPSARVVVPCFKLDPLERILAEDVRWLVSPISNRAFTLRLCFWTPGSNKRVISKNEKHNSLPVCLCHHLFGLSPLLLSPQNEEPPLHPRIWTWQIYALKFDCFTLLKQLLVLRCWQNVPQLASLPFDCSHQVQSSAWDSDEVKAFILHSLKNQAVNCKFYLFHFSIRFIDASCFGC